MLGKWLRTNQYIIININKETMNIEQKINDLEDEVTQIKHIISELRTEIIDFKEAFEHTDDSLQRVRTTISVITGNGIQ